MQAELAGLREKIRKAESERDLAAKDKAAAEQGLARGNILPVASLKEGLDKGLKSLDQTAKAAFPGYRPAPAKAGRIFYLYESSDPYRATVELNLVPISGSALTPDLPKVVFESRAGADGTWQMPGQSVLRELQAAAVARSSPAAERKPQAEPAPAPPSRPQQSAQQPQPQPQQGGSARVIDWGDSRGGGEARKPPADQPAPKSAQPSGNTPRAAESYEIRFND